MGRERERPRREIGVLLYDEQVGIELGCELAKVGSADEPALACAVVFQVAANHLRVERCVGPGDTGGPLAQRATVDTAKLGIGVLQRAEAERAAVPECSGLQHDQCSEVSESWRAELSRPDVEERDDAAVGLRGDERGAGEHVLVHDRPTQELLGQLERDHPFAEQ